jgi:hypothetical protein
MPALEPSPVHPLGPPTLSGNELTVDTMLEQPTRITNMIMDLSLQRFIIDRIFASAGGVTGGAVVYDVVERNELYASRDIGRVSPGGEFPLITSERPAPAIAEVEKWGGKVFLTDEARERNKAALFTNKMRQLTNTIIRKLNQRAIFELEKSITASNQKTNGNNWSAVVVGGSAQSLQTKFPAFDFSHAAQLAEEQELGIVYDLWILHPQEFTQLATIYGMGSLKDLLSYMGIDVYVSPRVTPGTAYVVASQQVGEMRVEKALGTVTWREEETERTWVQASVRPVMYVNNPFAVLKVEKLAG